MSDEWGPWIDGTVYPRKGAYVQVLATEDNQWHDDVIHEGVYLGMTPDDVLILSPKFYQPVGEWTVDRWRERKPRGLIILQSLIENLPAPVREREDA